MPRRLFSGLRLKDAMELVPAQNLTRWNLRAADRAPSDILLASLELYEVFDLSDSGAAKILLIDTVLAEIVSAYNRLKIWKNEPLETGNLTGFADYLIAPRRAYVQTPLGSGLSSVSVP
jgi:uncharacterized membrane protein